MIEFGTLLASKSIQLQFTANK